MACNRCPHSNPAAPIALVLTLAAFSTGAASAQEEPEGEREGTWTEVKEAYEKAKKKALEMGESVPEKIPDWIVEDLRNVGDWEYRAVETPREELEATLNELGAERWECFSVESHGKKAQLVLKRRKRSRLRELQDLSPDDLLTVIKLIRERRLDQE